jgi:hypothetical protein
MRAPSPRALPFPVTSTEVEEARRLLRPLIGLSLPQICVGAGDVQLRFEGDFTVSLWTEVRRTDGAGTPAEPYTLEGLSLLSCLC